MWFHKLPCDFKVSPVSVCRVSESFLNQSSASSGLVIIRMPGITYVNFGWFRWDSQVSAARLVKIGHNRHQVIHPEYFANTTVMIYARMSVHNTLRWRRVIGFIYRFLYRSTLTAYWTLLILEQKFNRIVSLLLLYTSLHMDWPSVSMDNNHPNCYGRIPRVAFWVRLACAKWVSAGFKWPNFILLPSKLVYLSLRVSGTQRYGGASKLHRNDRNCVTAVGSGLIPPTTSHLQFDAVESRAAVPHPLTRTDDDVHIHNNTATYICNRAPLIDCS